MQLRCCFFRRLRSRILGCYYLNDCYAVGSAFRTLESYICHLQRCTIEDGNNVIKHYGWECLYKGRCFKLQARVEIESYCATMCCLNGREERPKYKYMLDPLPAQFMVCENKCRDINENCVPKDSKYAVILQGKRYDNCSCSVVERPYFSQAQKTQGFNLEVKQKCGKK
ncbi:hypothetical protein PoB_004312600 [Plakobranchus ocellatus]|uniref:Uncharacterized protein n=1 Tax=Plakobranchus ocellatus TaxID=259542 RepID=A0AAV4BCU0_9GAST|nr:hypothetical protein PoB_004312600 [Plakobranchus ocellatus]